MTLRWRWVYAACLGVLLSGMAFFVFTGVYYYLEPRAPAEAVALPVTDQKWRESIRTPANTRFEVQVILPNGKLAWTKGETNWVRPDGMMCFQVSEGRWSGAYHLEPARPGDC